MATTQSLVELQRELERLRMRLNDDPEAVAKSARILIANRTDRPEPYRLLAAALRQLGRDTEADNAEREAIEVSARFPALEEAARAINSGQLQLAEHRVRSHLNVDPEDPEALRLLAEIAAGTGFVDDAEQLLRRVLALVPSFSRAYVNLATLLQSLSRTGEAIALLDEALEREPNHHIVLSFKAAMLTAVRRIDEALKVQEDLLEVAPDQAIGWINYGYSLKTVGRLEDAVAAYRKALELAPASGFAWWGLANLRTVKLSEEDVAALQKALRHGLDDLNRLQLHFALGKALGDQSRFEESFRHYEAGNAIRRVVIPYDPEHAAAAVHQVETVFARERLEQGSAGGAAASDPIFIVGMPRSGSTLVEQMLASHPAIEGAGELRELEQIAERIAGSAPAGPGWIDGLARLKEDALRALGEEYLSSIRACRSSDRPFFTDKMPSNWQYIALIHLILPKAKIIDVRRHPLACCFSNFTTHFNRTTNFAASLEDLGHHYRDYVRMVAHFDRVLPGRIYRIHHENLVEDPEGEVRRLLEHLGLPFDDACLRFYDNPRAVHTPSAQQVRSPINKEGMARWRNYEPWLGPLKAALGPVLSLYPEVPERQALRSSKDAGA